MSENPLPGSPLLYGSAAAPPDAETVDAPAKVSPTTVPHVPAPPTDAPLIAGYTITAEIARGGMGRVYAGRDVTLDREVAIKTLLPGAKAERFVRESKITARLPHPGIPPVHALGALADGVPYLVMKFVRGQTLAALLDGRGSPQYDLPRFVQVFEQIAQAVGFAHSQGIIHRDLKPLNVMVGAFGEVQVMDWGLAKDLTSDNLESDETGADENDVAHTRAGAVMGTPGYMAPEQARGEAVDVRADVFALGSTLAAILTGQPAFVGNTALATVAKAAGADLADVFTRLDRCGADGELVALAKQCLAANPAQRPQDARQVAEAVANYRAGVQARLQQAQADEAAARARESEQRKRRRALQWAGGALVAVLLAGVAGTSFGLYRALEQEAEARKQETEAKKQTRLARTETLAKEKARQAEAERAAGEKAAKEKEALERKYAEGIADFVVNDFLALTSIEGQGRFAGKEQIEFDPNLTLKQMLDRAAEKLDRRKDLSPRTEAELRWMIGVNYRAQGNFRKAIPHLERSLDLRRQLAGANAPETINAQNSLGVAYLDAQRGREALELLEPACAAQVQAFGADHLDTFAMHVNLARAYEATGKLPEAIALFEKVQEASAKRLGPEHSMTLNAMGSLAAAYERDNKLPQAIVLFERVRDGTIKARGADHPDIVADLNNLGRAYQLMGRLSDALQQFEHARAVALTKLEPEHPFALASLNNVAFVYGLTGRLEEAISLFEQVRDSATKTLGPDHPNTVLTHFNLGVACRRAGKLPQALTAFEQGAAAAEKGKFLHPRAQLLLLNLAEVQEEVGQYDKAETWRRKLLAVLKPQASADAPVYAGQLAALGSNLLQQKKWSAAEKPLLEALTIREKAEPDAWTTFNTKSMLGAALLGQKKHTAAEPLLLAGYEGLKKREPTIPPQAQTRIPEALDRVIEIYAATERPNEEKKYRELRAAYVKERPKRPDKK